MAHGTGVVTPEAVVLEFETGGIGSRLLAGLIDALVQGAMLFGLVLVFFTVGQTGAVTGGLAAALVYGSLFLVIFGYPAALETLWRGRTLGKAALGLRVVTVEGAPIRFRHAAIRSIFNLIDRYLFTGLVGILALLFSARNQRLGDIVAGTLVLRERSASRAPRPVSFPVPAGLEPYVSTLDVTGLASEEYGAVRSFLLRAPSLPPDVRHDLALRLALPLTARLHTTPPTGVGPELFLACVASAVQRRTATAGADAPPAPTIDSVWSAPRLGVLGETRPPPR